MKRPLTIMDNTLREGEQTAGVVFTSEEKIAIAENLDKAGVDFIEAGFPAVSNEELRIVKKIANLEIKAKVMALSRTSIKDIDLVVETGAYGVSFFTPTSKILHKAKSLELSDKEMISISVKSIQYAKNKGLFVAFGAEDSTRTSDEFIIKLYSAALDAGADIVAIVDTTSRLTPIGTYEKVKKYKEKLNGASISLHLHNDFGMATANAVAGVIAGADQIQTTINGIGERAGSPCLQEVVMSVNTLTEEKFEKINTEKFMSLTRLIEKATGIKNSPLSPIVGENAFAHESGLHASAVIKNPLSYEPFSPEDVGASRKFVIGKHTGKKIIEHILKSEFGVDNITNNDLEEIVKKIKEESSIDKRKFSAQDVFELYSQKYPQNKNI